MTRQRIFLRAHRLQTLPCNRLWHKQAPIEYPLHLTSILSPLKPEYIERVQIFASPSRPPKKSKPMSPKREFSPCDHKKLLNGNQLAKLWFLPISIGLLFVVTYPYCSLKLLSVLPARTSLRAFKKSHLEGNISDQTQPAGVDLKRRHFYVREIKNGSVIAPFDHQHLRP